MEASELPLLPREQLENHVSQVYLLMGMYPDDDELNIDATTYRWLEELREWTAFDVGEASVTEIPPLLAFELNLNVKADTDEPVSSTESSRALQLSIEVPTKGEPATLQDSPQTSIHVRLRQPSWMTRAQTSTLNNSIPANEEDVFGMVEHIQSEASKYLHRSTTTSVPPKSSSTTTILAAQASTQAVPPIVRVWFYFPSLSTRAKRNDLVIHAPAYSLTGFVLAGKPGILCLEGMSRDIDEYMRFIKTESWGDIPSHHKKVSERYRETVERRVFEDMQEITDASWMGEKRGERGNRSDLRLLEGWLDGLGLNGLVEKVLM